MCIPRLDGARGNRVEIPVWIKEVCFLGIGGGLISAEERRFSGWVQPENAFLKSMIRLRNRISVLSVSFDSLAPAQLTLRANLRLLYLKGSPAFSIVVNAAGFGFHVVPVPSLHGQSVVCRKALLDFSHRSPLQVVP